MATVVRENIGSLHDKLTVKVDKDDYLPAFDKKLKEYGKTANIPGFRKGMVPAGMIKKMYGPSIFTDEILKSVEKELYGYLNKERPEMFGQPLPLKSDMNDMDLNAPSSYEFGFEIGLKPDYTIADLSKAKPTFHKVNVTDEMVNDEINRMQIKAGKLVDQDVVDNPENVINLVFKESDAAGNEVENGVTKDNSVILKYFTEPTREQFKGKKVGDLVLVQLNKAFEADKLHAIMHDLGYDHDHAAEEKYFKLEIAKIGLINKRDLDETFFKEIYPGRDIKTEDELKSAIKEEIIQYWDAQSHQQLQDQLYHYLIDETHMEFPQEFLKRWLQTAGDKERTAEEAEKEYPSFINSLKWTLISDKLSKENKLEVTNEELRDFMKAEVTRYFGNMSMGDDTSWLDSYVDRMMKDEKQVEAHYRRLENDKLFKWLETQVKPTEKIVSAEDLAAMQHHHHH